MFEISDNTTAFKPIAGRQLRRHRATSRLSIAQRTVIAAHLSEHGLSITKAADITCVNTRYVFAGPPHVGKRAPAAGPGRLLALAPR